MNSLGRREKQDKSSVFTKETLGVVLILFSTLLTVCLITREKVFYSVGQAVNTFLFGCFGYFAYAVMMYVFIKGIMLVIGKKSKFTIKFRICASVMFLMIALLGQVISVSAKTTSGYGEYLKHVYMMAEKGGITTCSAGGLFTGLIAYPLNKILSDVGSYVVFSAVILITGYFTIREYGKKSTPKQDKSQIFRGSFNKRVKDEELGIEYSGEIDYPVSTVATKESVHPTGQKLFVTNAEDFQMKSRRELNKDTSPQLTLGKTDGGLYMGGFGNSYMQANSDEMQKKIEYIKTPAKLDFNATKSAFNTEQKTGTTISNYIPLKKETNPAPSISQAPVQQPQQEESDIPMYFHDQTANDKNEDSAKSHAESFVDRYADIEEVTDVQIEKQEPTEIFRPVDVSNVTPQYQDENEEIAGDDVESAQAIFEQLEEINKEQVLEEKIEQIIQPQEQVDSQPSVSPIIKDRRARSIFGTEDEEQKKEEIKPAFDSRVKADNNEFSSRREPISMGFGREISREPIITVEEEKPKKVAPPINRVYNAPPLDLLESYDSRIDDEGENHTERMEIIRRTLENFHINTEPVGYIQGPTVTRYELRMPLDVSVKKVVGLADDLKMRLQSYDGIRIQAPVPGKDVIGIEVSNKHPVTVGLRELLETSSSKPAKPGSLMFAIGKDVVGSVITDNLADGPHYLVAGGTNSGKSVCLNVMILSMIMRYSPEELKLILVDPKMVEFTAYEHLPHLVSDEIISDAKRAIAAFQWAIVEMERRYELFSQHRVSNIVGYNSQVASDKVAKMPRIVIVVDELSNLMESCKKDMEAKILSLAQKARAAGIHLVLATQRPSVDIITGTIKANLPSRIALRLSNFADSNTIIAEGGAEKLLGRGDMLYKNSAMSDSVRYQGAFLSDAEKINVVNYIKEHNVAYFDDELKEFLDESTKEKQDVATAQVGNGYNNYDINDVNAGDPIFLQALWLAVNTGTVAVSQLQRRFRLGYGRAGALVDRMEQLKLVSGNEGSKARRVLITREEFLERYGPVDDTF